MRKTKLVMCIMIIGISIVLLSLSSVSAVTWRSNGIETMSLDDFGNLNVSGNLKVIKNITTSGYGFFGWIGSLVDRITKLFVQDIDFSGNINGTGNITTTGSVGIGTISPSSSLEVYGGNITLTNSTASENNYFKFGRGGYMYDNGTAVIIGHY